MLYFHQEFYRSIQTGNLDLWVHDVLCHISQQITEIKVTHAEMHKDFINGLFSMKTTKKAFSRLPVDLTLE